MFKIFEIKEPDGDLLGLLKTSIDEKIVQIQLTDYWNNSESEELCIEGFIDQLNNNYPEKVSERFFIDGALTP